MAKRTVIEGYSVIYFVEAGDDPADALAVAETMVECTRGWHLKPDIEPQIAETCEHCGAKWTPPVEHHNLCCDADLAEYDAAKRKALNAPE